MTLAEPTFCPICGNALTRRDEGGRNRPACSQCGYIHFVNPVPGVGMLIEMDEGLVLIQRGHPPHEGQWTLPSGFVEADESAEEAAIREAEEETGLKTEIIELANINSFPEGPPVSGIMIFYRMRPVGGTLCAGDDAAAAKVFTVDELPLLPFRTHREMVAEWLEKYAAQPGRMPPKILPTFNIRPFVASDVNEVLSLLMTIPANRNLQRDEIQAAALRMTESDTVQVFVAETNQFTPMIIGFIALSIVRNLTGGAGLISDMAVLPTYQRRGVGAELLEAAMRSATEVGLHCLWVDQQRANDQARAFYSALGFEDRELTQIKLR